MPSTIQPWDTTPDANDLIQMSIGGRIVSVNQTDFLTNFIGGLTGTTPDKNDRVLMGIGTDIVSVTRDQFINNFLGGLSKTVPDLNDRVIMSIGKQRAAVSLADFVAGGWATPPTQVVLNDVTYNLGTWMPTLSGQVALASPTLGLVDPTSSTVVAWSFVSHGSGTQAHMDVAGALAAGKTPGVAGASAGTGYKQSGVYSFTLRGTDANGRFDDAVITINRNGTKSSIGDTGTGTNEFQTLGSSAATAVAGGFTGFWISTGVVAGRNILLQSTHAFSALVPIEYADPLRPSILLSCVLQSVTNLHALGLRCAGKQSDSFYGNFQISGTNVGLTNCKAIDTEATYGGTTNNNGFCVVGGTTTAFLTFDENDTISATHKYRGIYIDNCASVVITRPFLSLNHAQGLYYSPNAKNITVIEPIIIGLFKTRYPVPDIVLGGTHLEPTQVADPGDGGTYPLGQKVDNLTIKGIIALPSLDQNCGGRGFVMGHCTGAVILDGGVLGGWGPDGFESYNFGAGSQFKRMILTRVRSGDESFATEINDETKVPGYDVPLSAMKFTINQEDLPVGATVTVDECYVDNVIFIKGTDTYAALTIGPDVYSYARTPMVAGNGGQITAASLPASPNAGNANAAPNLAVPDPVGFAGGDVKLALEALCNNPAIRTMTHKQIRDAVAAICNRADGKGPFANTAGFPWQYAA